MKKIRKICALVIVGMFVCMMLTPAVFSSPEPERELPYWHSEGNDAGKKDVLGTLNNQDLRIVTYGEQRMIVTAEGNVGIGIAEPVEKLDVAGNVHASGSFIAGSSTTYGDGYIALSPGINLNIDSGTLFIDSVNDRVGIGTTSPSGKLEVVGDIIVSGTVDGVDISDAYAEMHAIDDELWAAIDAEEAARIAGDAALQATIDAEIAARMAADAALQAAITAEEAARIAADNALQDAINAEAAARAAADLQLQDNIDAEATARIAADNALQAAINAEIDARIAADAAEVAARQAADQQLQDNIDAEEAGRIAADAAEVVAREAADQQLQDNIDTEEAARIAADNALQAALNAEITARIAADDALQAALDAETAARIAADNAEAAARMAADDALQQNINDEEAARIAADNALQAAIDAEEAARIVADNAEAAARQAADQQLQDNIDQEIADRIADVDAEEAARILADDALQAAITAEIAARIAADDTLQANIDALAAEDALDYDSREDLEAAVATGFNIATISGNVGIGIASPVEKLDVAGNVHASGSFMAGSSTTYGDGYIALSPGINLNIDSGTLFIDGVNDRVGIGTVTPAAKLTIEKGAFLQTTGDPTLKGSYISPTNIDVAYGVYVSGKYAYVTGIKSDSLAIIDISNPSSPTYVGSYKSSMYIERAHSVYVSGKYAYVTGHASDSLAVIDISNPSSPAYVGSYKSSTNIDSAMDVYVSGKYAYVTGHLSDSLAVIDISNPSSPAYVGKYTSSTNINNPTGVYVSGKYAYVTGHASDSLAVIDISNPSSPTYVGSYKSSMYIDGAHSVYVSGKYVYVTGYYSDSLAVIDIAGIDSPAAQIGDLAVGTLDVWENAHIANNLYVDNGLNVGPGGLYVDAGHGISTDGDLIALGKVGIGTATPATKLDVNGVITATGGNSDQWNTAYGWGDHSLAGYLTSESDPVFTASAAYGITSIDISNWNTAYGWGDHSLAGYLTSESDPVFVASAAHGITSGDISNWNTAYGWGDHGAVGYLTSESDPQVGANTLNYVPKWDGSALVTGTIYDNGNVGIGTDSPSGLLGIQKNHAGTLVYLEQDNTGQEALQVFGPAATSNTISVVDLYANNGAIPGIHLKQSGNVGIGTTSPSSKLHVSGGTGSVDLFIEADINDAGEGDQPSITLSQDGGIVKGKIGYFDSENKLSIYNQYGDSLTLGANNNKNMMVINSAGKVGIGTTGPNSQLQVGYTNWADASNPQVLIHGVNNEAETVSLEIRDENSNTYMTVGSTGAGDSDKGKVYINGKVGIGTTSPLDTLHIRDSKPNDVMGLKIQNYVGAGTQDNTAAQIGFYPSTFSSYAAARIVCGRDDTMGWAAHYRGNLQFHVGKGGYPWEEIEAMRIDHNGNVGIGTTSPGATLDVRGDMRIDSGGSTDRSLYFRNQAAVASIKSDADLRFMAGVTGVPTEFMRIKATTGNVGIGTTSPSQLLHIESSDKHSDIRLKNTGPGASDFLLQVGSAGDDGFHIYDMANTAYRFMVSNSGNVGIGTTTPGKKLDVNGAIRGTTLNSGLGDYELYAMNQNVRTTDGVSFATVNTGYGACEIGQNLRTTDGVTFANVNTGHGANELYAMNQNVRKTDNPTFNRVYLSDYGYALGGFHVGGSLDPGTDNLIVDGKVGIGTTDPGVFKLKVVGSNNVLALQSPASSTTQLAFYDGATRKWVLMKETNNKFGFYSDTLGSRVMTLQENGNVGIGTTSPGAKLDVDIGSGWSGVGGATTIGHSDNLASGDYAIALGYQTTAIGHSSIAMGHKATASGSYSIAMGRDTTANGHYSTAMGYRTTASEWITTAMGLGTTASGFASTAMGSSIIAQGDYSFGIGLSSTSYTITQPNTMAIMGGKVGIGAVNPGDYKLCVETSSGRAIYGYSSDSIGVYGRSPDSYAVYGRSDESYGVYGRTVNGYGVYGRSDNAVGVRGSGDTYDFYASGSGTNYGPFTGAHEVKLSDAFPENIKPGMIVSVTGETQIRNIDDENISFSSTLPTVQLSDTPEDNKVLGVIISECPLDEDHWYINESEEGDRFGIVNALGEGRVLVTNITGDIMAGDYITTSAIAGYGQKQSDDLLHSYTFGKATENVDWSEVTETVEFDGLTYKAYAISVVYTSG